MLADAWAPLAVLFAFATVSVTVYYGRKTLASADAAASSSDAARREAMESRRRAQVEEVVRLLTRLNEDALAAIGRAYDDTEAGCRLPATASQLSAAIAALRALDEPLGPALTEPEKGLPQVRLKVTPTSQVVSAAFSAITELTE